MAQFNATKRSENRHESNVIRKKFQYDGSSKVVPNVSRWITWQRGVMWAIKRTVNK